ncbi:MAG: CoA pyrophosphatase [Desulfobacteraceae bacterium]|nr:CoA pyrophosphatase [Desulfobacteraceae bacterium]
MDDTLLDQLIDRLPDCANILARDKYHNYAVLVPLIFIDGEYHLVFEKRSPSISQGSEVCFPGGRHDPTVDKNCRETAVRETVEELGIPENRIRVLGRFDTLVASTGATVDAFLGLLDIPGINELAANRSEVENVFTLPVSFFMNAQPESYQVRLMVEPSYIDKHGKEIILFPAKELGLPEAYHTPWGKTFHRVLVYKTDKETVWGITAEIINDMISKLKKE